MKSKERDIYFQKAVEEGYLARSAYKLLQIDEIFNIFEGVTRAIDLCSAPGSWTQVIYNKLHGVFNDYDPARLNPNAKIISVDLMPMDAFPSVIHLQADISQYSTMKKILDEFDDIKADIVVCDGAIDVIGMNHLDYYMHHRIFLSALYITLNTLKTGGTFVMKIFIDMGHQRIVNKLCLFFRNVTIVKPHCSRNREAFAVCRNYMPSAKFDPVKLTPFVEMQNVNFSNLTGIYKKLIPYLCVDNYSKEFSEKEYTDLLDNESEFCNLLKNILKDKQSDALLLKKRILKSFPVYRITVDNNLEYDEVYADNLFKDLIHTEENEVTVDGSCASMSEHQSHDHKCDNLSNGLNSEKREDGIRSGCSSSNPMFEHQGDDHKCDKLGETSKEILDEVYGNFEEKNKLGEISKDILERFAKKESDESSNSLSHIDCSKTQEERSRIRGILDERIEALRLENRGKFPGLGFNLRDWKFFARGFKKEDVNSSNSEALKQTYDDLQTVYKKLRENEGVKCRGIKNLVLMGDEMKTKIRERFVTET